jgi:hypothetical protein
MPTDPDKALEQLLRTLGVREAPERQRGKEELRRLGGDNKQFLAKVWKDKAVDPLYFVPQRYQSALQHDFQVHSFPWDEVVEARRLRHIRQTLADVAPRLHALHRTLVSVRQDLEVIPSENQDQYLEALKDLANDRYAPPQPESKEGMGKPLLPFFSEQDGLVADQLRFLVGTSRFSRFLPDGPAPKTLPLLVRALGKNPKDLKRARQDEFDRVQTRVGDDRLRGVLVKAYRDLEEFLVDLGKAGNDLAPP